MKGSLFATPLLAAATVVGAAASVHAAEPKFYFGECGMLLAICLDVEQPLGARIGEDDFTELIDGDHRINQAAQNLAKLVALGDDAADANLRGCPRHFQFFRPVRKFGQTLAYLPAGVAPKLILFPQRNTLDGLILGQGVQLQRAKRLDVMAGSLRAL